MKMKKFKDFFNDLISAIYPNKCISCGKIILENQKLCNECFLKIERNNLNDICFDCGFEKSDCVCKHSIYRFNALVCVFKNIGVAQDAYYKYKFYKKQHYADFFANELCAAVKECYGNIDFDIICSVPSFEKFGYNHCGYIAKIMSKNLNIYYDKKLLICVKKTKKQHKSSIKERLINADGKYKCCKNIYDKNVLLIDDIKTTGATIDECSKELLFAGAKSVYCATVLGAVSKK